MIYQDRLGTDVKKLKRRGVKRFTQEYMMGPLGMGAKNALLGAVSFECRKTIILPRQARDKHRKS
jgi:hypothetical protein